MVYALLPLKVATPENKPMHPAQKGVLGRMQLALHATRRTPYSASRLMLSSDVCLVGEYPMCTFPTLQGCEGLWSYDYGHA